MISICWGAGIIAGAPAIYADDFDDFSKSLELEFDDFKQSGRKEYDDFRLKANEEMAEFMGRPWEQRSQRPKIVPPPDPSPEPVIIDDDIDNRPLPNPSPVVIDSVIDVPAPRPQPQPIAPIRDITAPSPVNPITCRMYGTDFTLRGADLRDYRINGHSGADFGQAWRYLCGERTNNLLIDCLAERDKRHLCDWAYLMLLKKAAETAVGGDRHNESALLTGFLLYQSGYKMRFAIDSQGSLHVFFAATGHLYDRAHIVDSGQLFFALTEPCSAQVEICSYSYPKEKSLSFAIDRRMQLAFSPAPARTVTARFHPELSASVSVNKNLIDFYNDYPEATLNDSPYTKWAIYANTPASDEVVRDLYPAIRKAIEKKSQRDAANMILHLAETFPYGYDDKIWGRDRAFFLEETWHYPYSDCEDHAIHFSRMIRDIMDLDVVLVYYPGHLASAVAFTDPEITGDYFIHRGRRFTVCDPTIFYSNIGETMKGMDNSGAVLIDLKR